MALKFQALIESLTPKHFSSVIRDSAKSHDILGEKKKKLLKPNHGKMT